MILAVLDMFAIVKLEAHILMMGNFLRAPYFAKNL